MNKPIEEGCLAVIIKGKNTGMEVTVGKFIGRPDPNELGWFIPTNVWEIDKKLKWANKFSMIYLNLAPEDKLMRIDDYDDSLDVTEEELIYAV